MAQGYDVAQDPQYQQLYKQILGNTGAGGFVWNPTNTSGVLDDQISQFASMYQNMTGQAPTQDVIDAYSKNIQGEIFNSPTGEYGSNYSQNQDLNMPYLQNTYGPQIQQHQTDVAQGQLGQAQTATQNSINTMDQNTEQFLTSPEAQAQMKGSLNNSGMIDSGAYDSTLASLMSQGALQNQNNAIQGLTVPAEQGIMGTAMAPYGNAISGSGAGLKNYGAGLTAQSDFNQQAALGEMLAKMGQPSTAQSIMGMASGSAQGAGSLAQGGASAYNATSYVCMELIRRGLAHNSDLDLLHWKIMPAVFLKGRAFWNYAQNAQALVNAANVAGINWRLFRKELLDDVIAAPSALEAVERYTQTLHRIAIMSGYPWDPRVTRTGVWDSLWFMPRLLTYSPFVKAFAKAMRMRSLLLLDLPLSEMR